MIVNSSPNESTLQLALRIAIAVKLLKQQENPEVIIKVLTTATQTELLNDYSKRS